MSEIPCEGPKATPDVVPQKLCVCAGVTGLYRPWGSTCLGAGRLGHLCTPAPGHASRESWENELL